jgi:hypothetical protein
MKMPCVVAIVALFFLAISSVRSEAQVSAKKDVVWMIPECSGLDTLYTALPFLPKFVIPSQAKVERFSDVDYGRTSIKFSDTSSALELWWGLVSGPGDRERNLRSKSIELKERRVVTLRGAGGTDLRGLTKDGKLWRSVRFSVGFVIYAEAAQEIARQYDRVIDSACFPLSRSPKSR